MFGIPFSMITAFLAILMISMELDAGHAVLTFLKLQGIGEASTLAGDAQQTIVVTENQSGTGAPLHAGYVVKSDGSAQLVAMNTWQKNIAQQEVGPWTTLTPTFTLSRQDANTPVGQLDTVSTTLSATVTMPMSAANFHSLPTIPMTTTVASTVHNTLN